MRKIEIILVIIGIILLFLQLFSVPLSNVLLMLLSVILGCFYVFGSWYLFTYNGYKNTALSTISGWIFSIALVALLLNINKYPGFEITLLFSTILLMILIFVLSYFLYKQAKQEETSKKKYLNKLLFRAVIYYFLPLWMYFILENYK